MTESLTIIAVWFTWPFRTHLPSVCIHLTISLYVWMLENTTAMCSMSREIHQYMTLSSIWIMEVTWTTQSQYLWASRATPVWAAAIFQ